MRHEVARGIPVATRDAKKYASTSGGGNELQRTDASRAQLEVWPPPTTAGLDARNASHRQHEPLRRHGLAQVAHAATLDFADLDAPRPLERQPVGFPSSDTADLIHPGLNASAFNVRLLTQRERK